MKKRFAALAGILGLAVVLAAVGCTGGGWYDKDIWMTAGTAIPTEEAVLPTDAPNHGTVAVHDPSVFYDDVTQKYYAFGTHYAVASSTDLITWKQEVSEGNTKALYGDEGADVKLKTLKETLGISGTLDTWAPDVMKIGNMYYMYLSATSAFGSNRSGIVRVRANNVMGPYREEETIIFSGGNGGEPNCIDPELFYDKDGKLWMVYGSFFAGVYIKELDEKGLPVEDGFGTLLWKGDGIGVEGPFIFYNAETDYYYLMTSDGNLNTNYNMRVVRSKNPDGPYEDVKGVDPTRDTHKGVKLAGNYKFDGGGATYALGHNSVIKKDGKYLVVCHVRNALSGMHHLEVRQLFFNKDGWPVMSPNRYCGETAGTVTEETIAGEYDVVLHIYETQETVANSEAYTFGADGKILKGTEEKGAWELSDGYFVKITLDGTEYNGVVSPAIKDNGNKAAWCMTATSDNGRPIWANGK